MNKKIFPIFIAFSLFGFLPQKANAASQAQKFDFEGEYIRQWVPELSSMDTEYLVTGKITPLERQAVGYPEPIVEHKKQQKLFKEMYKNEKQKIETLG